MSADAAVLLAQIDAALAWVEPTFSGEDLMYGPVPEWARPPDYRGLLIAARRALAAQAEAGDGYRIALDDALPVLELCLERGQVLDRMTQPSMGRHPLQDEYERVDCALRRACRPYKLIPIVQQARAGLAAAEEVG